MPNGLNDPEHPEQVGWGGCHQFGLSPDGETSAWTNWQDPLKGISSTYEHKFYPDEFNDFAARMQWAAEGSGNRNPVVVIDGNDGLKPLEIKAKPGKTLTFNASASSDPDGDALRFEWWFQEFPGQMVYPAIDQPQDAKVQVSLPDTPGTYHLVCEVHDTGPFTLPAYRRIIITVE